MLTHRLNYWHQEILTLERAAADELKLHLQKYLTSECELMLGQTQISCTAL